MKKNLKYLLMGVFAICLFMYFVEGFNPDTECCAPNNFTINALKGMVSRGTGEGSDDWWKDTIRNVGCGGKGDECTDDNQCDIYKKLTTYRNGGNLFQPPGSYNRINLCNPH